MSKRDSEKNRSPQDRKGKAKNSTRRLYLPAILSRAIFVLGCFILFLPVIVSYDFYIPYIFFKSILLRGIVQAMVFLYATLAVVSPSHRPKFNRIHFGLIAYMAVMLLCSLPGVSINAWDSWWGTFARMDGMIAQLHLLAYFLVLSQTFRRQRDWMMLFSASLFSGVLVGLAALVQNTGLDFVFRFVQRTRMEGSAANAGFFASYMLLNLLLSLYFLARKDRSELYPRLAKTWLLLLAATDVCLVVWDLSSGRSMLLVGLSLLPIGIFTLVLHLTSVLWFAARRKTWAGFSFLILLCIYYVFWINQSQTRAVIAGLGAALLFVALLYAWKGAGKRMKLIAALMILFLGVLPFAIWQNRNSGWIANNPLVNRLATTSFTEHRFSLWQAAFRGMLDHPLLGWGLENHNNAVDIHAPARLFFGELGAPSPDTAENWFDRTHNMFLDVGTTSGVLGLAVYLWFYGIIFGFLMQCWFKRRSTETLLIAGLLLGYLVQSLFTFDTINTNVILFLMLAYVAYLHDRPEQESLEIPETDRVRSSISWNGFAMLASTATALVFCYWYCVKRPYDANLLLNSGIALETDKGSPQAGAHYLYRESVIDYFEQADSYGATGRHEVREEFANYASEIVRASYVPVQDRVRTAQKAIAFLEESIQEDPVDARHYMYLASIMNTAFPVLSQTDPPFARSMAERALSLLEKAEMFGPNRSQTVIQRAQALVNLGRIEEAIQSLRKAIEINSGLKAARFDLVALYISAGHYEEAQREWQNVKTLIAPSMSDYDRMIGLYASKKSFGPVIDLYKQELQMSPDDPGILARLAAAYRELGDMESARANALRAAALSPRIAAQLQEFLKTLKK